MNWTAITDELPTIGQPVVLGWTSAPWFKDGRPDVALQAYCRSDEGAEGWLWAEWFGGSQPAGDACDWDADEAPTHWMPWPEPPVQPATV